MIVETPLPGDLRAVLERAGGVSTLRFLDYKNALGQSRMSSIPPPPGFNSEAPAADAGGDREESSTARDYGPLDVDASSPTIRPQMIGGDDD
ncbi:MAG: hypothetical protein H3C60_11295 [Sphingomonadaceae bacterium]|nr:hypothetical protein [Sphingomonadaceae bacterium]